MCAQEIERPVGPTVPVPESTPDLTERIPRLLLAHWPLGPLVRRVARLRAPVHAKLLGSFLLIALLLIAMGVMSLQSIATVSRQSRLLDQARERVDASRQIEHALGLQMNSMRNALLVRDDATIESVLHEKNRFGDTLNRLERSGPPGQSETIKRIRATQDQVMGTVARIAALTREGKADEAMALHLDEGYPLYREIATLVTQAVRAEEAGMGRLRQSVETTERQALLLMGGFAAASILLALGLGFVISWSFILPVREAEKFLGQVAKGDFGSTIDVPNRDEFGSLAGRMNHMSRELHQLSEDQRQAAHELGARNRDLTEALEQQTATSEILRVISQSPTDVQPVFDIIAERAVSLCEAEVSVVSRFDGTLLQLAALHGVTREGVGAVRAVFPMRLDAETLSARAFRGRAVIHEEDVFADTRYQVRDAALAGGWRGSLAVPMLRGAEVLGVIFVGRSTPGLFSDSQIELLKTFADQAVIAVENVRLFRELQARTGELTRSVEQLTALGEISRAVSSTLDVETVLDTIVSHASQLAGGAGCAIYEYDEAAEQFELRATHNFDPGFAEALRAAPLRKGEGLMGRAAEVGEPIQIPDISQPGVYQSSVRDTLTQYGYRALLSVPLLREEQIIGSLSLTRKAPGEYPPEVIEVLKTFATQSALAIQNARLFREIADKSRQLEVASRHKSEFLANMSHELRTPLNAIIGFSEVLNERMFGELNPKQEEYLKDIHASGQHLLSLINDILDLSKIEAGRMELEMADFDLPAAMDNAVTLVRERASRRGVTLKMTVGERVGMIRGDERKIRQVLLNLLSNAIKFTPEGGRIEIGAALRDGAVEVSVSDSGVGIAPEDQEAVFEEFRQVGASAAKQEGTGLGLALCRKFIELHGGTIRVTSAVGAGSTFTFRLPQ
jgi:signal transduction histidine kinase/CHASE3 domain sensor protein